MVLEVVVVVDTPAMNKVRELFVKVDAVNCACERD
jgi:hypothetical protein